LIFSIHYSPTKAVPRTDELGLAARCHEAKPEPRRRRKLFGNIAEDLSRLLAPLL